jgi:c-di-GMP-binding flagellar brake protein YcgR
LVGIFFIIGYNESEKGGGLMKFPFKIGDLIFLQQRLISKEEPLVYKSRVADFGEQHISIELPIAKQNGKYGFFLEGSEVDVWYEAKDGSKYQFCSMILGRKKAIVPLTLITYPEPDSIIRTQRRQFIRVPCYEEVAIHPVIQDQFTPFLAKAIDVSGGGLALSQADKPKLNEGDILRWWMCLPLKSGVILHPNGIGKLVRIIEPKEKGLHYKCTVQFAEVLEPERQKIMKYCFEKQLEHRKKGIE